MDRPGDRLGKTEMATGGRLRIVLVLQAYIAGKSFLEAFERKDAFRKVLRPKHLGNAH